MTPNEAATTQEQCFLEEIIANRELDAPRLIYADWLQERGDPRGEFIRIQCELAGLKKTQKQYKPLKERERDLLAQHEKQWTSEFPYSLRKCEFQRGFIETCSVAASYFERHWEEILALAPIRHVTFTSVNDRLASLAGVPGLAQIESIDLKNQNEHVGESEFAASQHLGGLRKLRAAGWSNEGVISLAQSESPTKLQELELPYCDLEASTIATLSRSEPLSGLRRLIVPSGLRRESIRPLCDATFAPSLEELDISRVDIEDEELQQLVSSERLTNLISLNASNGGFEWRTDGIKGPGLFALAESPKLAKLRRLVLSDHPMSYESIMAIGQSKYRKRGTRFYFGTVTLSDGQIYNLQQQFGKSFGNL